MTAPPLHWLKEQVPITPAKPKMINIDGNMIDPAHVVAVSEYYRDTGYTTVSIWFNIHLPNTKIRIGRYASIDSDSSANEKAPRLRAELDVFRRQIIAAKEDVS